MLRHRSKHLMETFTLEVLFVCKSVLRRNAKSDLWHSRTKNILKETFVRGREIYSGPTASLSDLWWQSSQCEILDMSDRVPALLRDFAGGELEALTNLVTSEVTHRSFRATWTAPDSPVDNYRVTYATVAGGPTQEVR